MLLINQDTVPASVPYGVDEQGGIDGQPSAKKRSTVTCGMAKSVFDPWPAIIRLDLHCGIDELLMRLGAFVNMLFQLPWPVLYSINTYKSAWRSDICCRTTFASNGRRSAIRAIQQARRRCTQIKQAPRRSSDEALRRGVSDFGSFEDSTIKDSRASNGEPH
jgi:hypothetical protein